MKGFDPNNVPPHIRAANPHIYGESTERVADTRIGQPVDDESKLHADIIDFCKGQSPPWLYFHGTMAEATGRTKGEPDFTLVASGGRVFFVECKKKGGKLKPDQRDVIHWAGLLGHKIHVVYNMEEFKEIVK